MSIFFIKKKIINTCTKLTIVEGKHRLLSELTPLNRPSLSFIQLIDIMGHHILPPPDKVITYILYIHRLDLFLY